MLRVPCRLIAPIEGVGLIIWWIVETIVNNPGDWWQVTDTSLLVTLAEWTFLLLVAIGLNWWMKPLVIHPPDNPITRKILGFFFKLTSMPKLDFEDSSIPTDYTPPVSSLCTFCILCRIVKPVLAQNGLAITHHYNYSKNYR